MLLFFGLHGGMILSKDAGILSVGIVLMGSWQRRVHYYPINSTEYSSIATKTFWVNPGPEMRLRTDPHTLVSFAYTYHAGFKLGLDYIL